MYNETDISIVGNINSKYEPAKEKVGSVTKMNHTNRNNYRFCAET